MRAIAAMPHPGGHRGRPRDRHDPGRPRRRRPRGHPHRRRAPDRPRDRRAAPARRGAAGPRPAPAHRRGSSSRSAGWSRCAPGRCWPPPTGCCTAGRTTSSRCARRARRTLVHRVEGAERDLEHARARVAALSPAATLERGYAVVQRADGALVRDPAEVADGELLRVRVAGGRLPVRVDRAAPRRSHPMSRPDERAGTEPTTTYEQAREELADVVRRLEAGGLTLEESLALWERGEELAEAVPALARPRPRAAGRGRRPPAISRSRAAPPPRRPPAPRRSPTR